MAWFAVNTKSVAPSDVRRMTPAETRALRRSVSALLKDEAKQQAQYDLELAKLGGCAFRRA